MKRHTGIKLLFICAALIFLFPAVTTAVLSVKGEEGFSISGYDRLFFDNFMFYPMFWNSVIYSFVITALEMIIILPAAFAFTFGNFKGKKVLFLFYVVLMMMPLQVMILPNYIGLRTIGLINTRAAVILPMVFSPFGVVVLYQYMQGIDRSVVEAARLETKSVFKIMFTAVVPQLKVCIWAVALFVFAESWNMLEQPMLFLEDEKLKTLPVFISNKEIYGEEILYPASVIFMIPVLLLYMRFHKELDNGFKLNGKKL